MTVSVFTMTSAVRHPGQNRDSITHSQRGLCEPDSPVRCSTCGWCRKARF
jgi:hypothetical protein